MGCCSLFDTDCVMSGLAVLGFKRPSFLQFEKHLADEGFNGVSLFFHETLWLGTQITIQTLFFTVKVFRLST